MASRRWGRCWAESRCEVPSVLQLVAQLGLCGMFPVQPGHLLAARFGANVCWERWWLPLCASLAWREKPFTNRSFPFWIVRAGRRRRNFRESNSHSEEKLILNNTRCTGQLSNSVFTWTLQQMPCNNNSFFFFFAKQIRFVNFISRHRIQPLRLKVL